MQFKTKKIKDQCWEMHLVEPDGEYVFGSDLNLNKVRQIAEDLHVHDNLVALVNRELTESVLVMYSRQAYDRWHWYDEQEMNKFISFFLLKYGGR